MCTFERQTPRAETLMATCPAPGVGSPARLGPGAVTIVPVTSNVSRVFPFQAFLRAEVTGLRVDSKAQAEQVRSVAVERLGSVLGRLPPRLMADEDEALRLHLQL